MSAYQVRAIEIENGVITTADYATTPSIKAFFADKAPAISIEPVTGWKFSRVYLTHGTMENGSGWAFVK